VPANGVVLVSTNGAVRDGNSSGGFVEVGVQVLVDGTPVPNVGELVEPISTGNVPSGVGNAIQNWALTVTLPLSAGQHTVSVAAKGVGSWGDTAFINDNNEFAPPSLTVTILHT